MSPASISISAILELRVCVTPASVDLRAGEDQRDGSRRIGQVGAFELKGGVGAPDADVGLGVGVQIVDGGDQLAGVRGVAVSTWRKSVILAVLASATVK